MMAWNPKPKVADCRELARRWGNKDEIIVLAIDEAYGTIEMVTYGRTRALRAKAKELGDAAFEAVVQRYGVE